MIPSLIFNAVLCLGVVVMIASLLVYAIRTAHRDVPAGSAKARLEAGTTLVRKSGRSAPRPRLDAIPQPSA